MAADALDVEGPLEVSDSSVVADAADEEVEASVRRCLARGDSPKHERFSHMM